VVLRRGPGEHHCHAIDTNCKGDSFALSAHPTVHWHKVKGPVIPLVFGLCSCAIKVCVRNGILGARCCCVCRDEVYALSVYDPAAQFVSTAQVLQEDRELLVAPELTGGHAVWPGGWYSDGVSMTTVLTTCAHLNLDECMSEAAQHCLLVRMHMSTQPLCHMATCCHARTGCIAAPLHQNHFMPAGPSSGGSSHNVLPLLLPPPPLLLPPPPLLLPPLCISAAHAAPPSPLPSLQMTCCTSCLASARTSVAVGCAWVCCTARTAP
jgi:hypothetical protein